MRSSTGAASTARGRRPATYLFEVIVACRLVILIPRPVKVSASSSGAVGSRRNAASGPADSGDPLCVIPALPVSACSSRAGEIEGPSLMVQVNSEIVSSPGAVIAHGSADAVLERAAA